MKVFTIQNTPYDSHMYVVAEGQKCLIIDLGGDFSLAKEVLTRENLTPVAVLLTHCHFDHVAGIKSAIDNGVDVYIHTADAKLLETKEGTLAYYVGTDYTPVFDYKTFEEGDYDFDGIKVKVILTSGHTKGSVSFLIEDCLFTGDTLFSGCVGRCDLPGGSEDDMKNSVNRLIALLFDETVNYKVYPGHGRFTDLRHEAETNPFVLNAKN